MDRADRAFGALLVVALGTSALVAIPLVLTLFPTLIGRLLRGSNDALLVCAGVLTSVHADLPPFGFAALALTTLVVAPASFRLARGRRSSARPLVEAETPGRLRVAAERVGIPGRVVCVDDAARYAYCAGVWRPRIYVSRGAVRALRTRELEAVLWHEAHHLRRHDPLRALVARSIAALFTVIPAVTQLAARFEAAKELDADQAALRAQGTPRGVAGALLALDSASASSRRAFASAWSLAAVRIDQLAGAEPAQLLPHVSRTAIALSGMVFVFAVVIAFGQAVRAQLIPFGSIPEVGAIAHVCPVPVSGPLL